MFPLVFMLLGAVLIIAGIKDKRVYKEKTRDRKKYRFEHTTDGGVVQFASFEAAEKFEREGKAMEAKSATSTLLIVFGGWSVFIGFAWFIAAILTAASKANGSM